MITIATLFWRANQKSQPFSAMYTEAWVEKLLNGFARNLTDEFRFVCFVDRIYPRLSKVIDQRLLESATPGYADCIAPYSLNEPMILCGLDTVVTGNCDDLARYCLEADTIALPRDPYSPEVACNGVALVPAGKAGVYESWSGENDMAHMRAQPHVFIDDIFPGAVRSYKGSISKTGLGDTRIAYFHGLDKPHELIGLDWIRKHWR